VIVNTTEDKQHNTCIHEHPKQQLDQYSITFKADQKVHSACYHTACVKPYKTNTRGRLIVIFETSFLNSYFDNTICHINNVRDTKGQAPAW